MIGLGGAAIADWMVDTFIYTSLLIGLVLLVRRRVAEYFGPQIAYALWALPLLRFLMPPFVLPAWMKPAEPVAEAMPAAAAGDTVYVYTSAASDVAADAAAPVAAPWFDLTVTDILLPLWLGGAAIFLAMRARDYAAMRRDLLAPSRPVGEAGDVRLVETPAVSAPVAFGIRDKVVALPPEFMDRIDVTARDMAIAHELEHHRGRDLLANIAAQPLLALHWFNPLAWWGWRAMRRDQEAACDARVVAGRARSERAQYAEVIAGFAAGEHLALAAPMACPVLGEKSIIHRLRSLTMQDISSRRRKIGIAAITTTALALPLTASISYAQEDPTDPPEPPTAPEPPMPVEGPLPDPVAWPDPAPDPVSDPVVEIIRTEDGETIIIRTESDGDGGHHVSRHVIRTSDGDPGDVMSEEELARMLAEVERELADLDIDIAREVEMAMAEAREARSEARAEAREARAEARAAAREARAEAGRVMVLRSDDRRARELHMDCDEGEPVVERDLGNGRTAIMVCNAAIQAHAAEGLREAIAEIRNDPDIPANLRREIIRGLEHSLQGMEAAQVPSGRVSFRVAPPEPPKVPEAPAAAPRVTFGFTATSRPAAATRAVPMVHPLTGRPATAEEDCDEMHDEVRVIA